MKKYLDLLCSMFSKDKDKKTKTQNLIFLLIFREDNISFGSEFPKI